MKKQQFYKILRFAAVALLTLAAVILPLENQPKYITLIAFALPFLLAGYDVLISAVKALLSKKIFNECFLMSLATIGAFAIGEYAEAVAVMLFYQIGEFFQDQAVERSRDSISNLTALRPVHADVIRGAELVRVLPDEVEPGETIVVRPGETVPLDGRITEGKSSLDTSALTGEALPRDVKEGDRVVSGSVNLTGLIEILVTEKHSESTAAKILGLIENQSEKKAKTEKFISRFARIYTPLVIFGALLLFTVPSLLDGRWSLWFERALIFLVVSCPCALVVSVPLSFFGGIGGASRKGILIKGASYVEALARINTAVFDKTGTLTEGIFKVGSVHPKKLKKEELLSLAVHAEYHSPHPVARSIVREWDKKIDLAAISAFEELPGLGVKAVVNEKQILCGNETLMRNSKIGFEESEDSEKRMHVAVDNEYAGYLTISDSPKPRAAEAIRKLCKLGVKKTVMLTGDGEAAAKQLSTELEIDEFKASLMPDGKLKELEALLDENKNGVLAYVGDGINDTLCLARADVGIAMGVLGSDAAIESADVVLMDDDPVKLATAVKGAKRTVRIVRQNTFVAIAVKFAVLALGALGYADMWAAVFADVGVTFICVINALRALKIK
ncbi:MAG: cadmium-translocating P-type ATPase [Clostridia bacterium]|nr:cadmium-translocating P-type ATPase [Clostridia bacterium]